MRYRTAILALLVCLLGALPALAGEVRGVIVRVDRQRNELQIEGRGIGRRGLAMTFTLDKDTRVFFGREAGELSDLVPGKRVRVVYEGDRAVSLHLFGLRALRGDARPARPDAMPARSDPNAVTGVLQRVSYAEREVVVVGPGPQGPETETIVSVPKDVRVVKDGKAIPFDELKDGQAAVVQTEKRDGKLLAKSIQVGQGAAAAAPAQPEAPTRIARIRRLLQLADRVLEMAEGAREQPKDPPK